MMKTTASLLALATVVMGQQHICAKEGTATGGPYLVNNNLWNQGSCPGWQCTNVNSISDNGVAFLTTFDYSQCDTSAVRSYANAGLNSFDKKLVSEIATIPTSVQWSYDTTNIHADISYDLFTASYAGHPTNNGDYELMIWVGQYGNAVPIGKMLEEANVGGTTWQLWYGTGKGNNANQKTFTFVAPTPINKWSGDVKQFFDYMGQHHGFPADKQFLTYLAFGTEPFSGGQATLDVTDFTASVN